MQHHMNFATESTATDFRIDEHTKLIGRQGIAAARARLDAIRSENEVHSHAA